jgi:hypothetical protein
MSDQDVINKLDQLWTIHEQEVSGRNTVQVIGSKKITSATGVIQLNPTYWHDIVIRLVSGSSTDTNVYVNGIASVQVQGPLTLYLNSSQTRSRIRGVQATSISTDSTIGSATIYCTYVGMSLPSITDIDLTEY